MQQFQQRMDVIGNNIANVNTTGFKGARIDFADSFSQSLGAGSGISKQIGTGVGTAAISNQFIQGAITNTGSPTDLAISQEGFFVVEDSISGAQFATRDGAFRRDDDGYLVTSGGLRVQGFSDSALTTRGDVRIDASEVRAQRVTQAQANEATAQAAYDAAETALAADPTNTTLQAAFATAEDNLEAAQAAVTAANNLDVAKFTIDPEGKITVRLSDGTEYIRGQVLLQKFQNPQALSKEGNNLYSGMNAAGALTQIEAPKTNGLGTIQSGALEMSNVDLANEFSSLITTQRGYQASARIITTSDEILQELVNLKR